MNEDPRALAEEAEEQPLGSVERINLLARAVQLAEAQNDVELIFELKQEFVSACIFGDEPDRALVAYAWCLGKYRATPEKFDEQMLLWNTKAIAANAVDFPQLTRARLEAIAADFEALYLSHGHSLRPLYEHRRNLALEFGDREAADEFLRKFHEAPRDRFADCRACEVMNDVEHALGAGDDDAALRAGRRVLASGLRCHSVPHRLHGQLLLPLLRTGQIEAALMAHRTGVRMMATVDGTYSVMAEHLAFLVATGNLLAAKRLASKFLPRFAALPTPKSRARFYVVMAVLCARLLEGKQTSWQLSLPSSLSKAARGAKADVQALEQALTAEVKDITAQFEKRNGCPSFTEELETLTQFARMRVDAPLTQPRAARKTES